MQRLRGGMNEELIKQLERIKLNIKRLQKSKDKITTFSWDEALTAACNAVSPYIAMQKEMYLFYWEKKIKKK
jgi:hypothetical protein